MIPSVPTWVEAVVAVLLLASGVLVLAAAWGMVRLKSYFQRMHAPALVFVAALWCVALADILYFSALEHALALRAWIIVILMPITVPVTTVLLARAALFRGRQAGQPGLPPPLQPRAADAAQEEIYTKSA